MGRIELRYCTPYLRDGLSGTAKVTTAPVAGAGGSVGTGGCTGRSGDDRQRGLQYGGHDQGANRCAVHRGGGGAGQRRAACPYRDGAHARRYGGYHNGHHLQPGSWHGADDLHGRGRTHVQAATPVHQDWRRRSEVQRKRSVPLRSQSGPSGCVRQGADVPVDVSLNFTWVYTAAGTMIRPRRSRPSKASERRPSGSPRVPISVSLTR